MSKAMDSTTCSTDTISLVEVVDENLIRNNDNVHNNDILELARVGKKQVLKRRFGLLSMFGFCCTITSTWEGVLLQFTFGLINGGPAGLIYGYILTWIGTVSIFMVMAELSSMLPTAGGQYHWVSVLAPRPMRRLLSYMTGWATVISWVAAATTSAFLSAQLIQILISLNIPSYQPQGWQGTLIMWGALLLSVFVTTALGSILPLLEILLVILHILGFFAVLTPLSYHAGEISAGNTQARTIFTTFFNFGGWSTQTLSFFVGLQGLASSLLGLDGAIHMAEEVEKGSINVARSMMLSIAFNGILGFATLIALLFAAGNLDALAQSTSAFPVIDVLVSSLDGTAGTSVIVAVMILLCFASTIATMSSAGRMIWSFARDRGLPAWQWLIRVDRRTSIPFNTIFVAATVGALLGLINIGSSSVFDDVISLVLEGFYTSYLFAASSLLYRRLRGEIGEPSAVSAHDSSDEGNKAEATDRLPSWGPWRVPGLLGTLNNAVAVVYLIVLCFFSFWPETAHVNRKNMDYACVVLGATMIGSLVWYFATAKRHYSGPVIEVRIATSQIRYDAK